MSPQAAQSPPAGAVQKFLINLGQTSMDMPLGARILMVEGVGNNIVIRAMTTGSSQSEKRHFETHFTDVPATGKRPLRLIGTVTVYNPSSRVYVFESLRNSTMLEGMTPRYTPLQLLALFENVRFRYATETDLQDGIAKVLSQAGVGYSKEHVLSPSDRPDFLVEGGIAIEIKIKGSFAQALRQIDRYTRHPDVLAVLLVGTPFWIAKMPVAVGGKPLHSLRLTGSLL